MRVLEQILPRRTTSSGELRFLTILEQELDGAAIARWRELFDHSCHQNPFLAPEFLLPAWRWLSLGQSHALFVVERRGDDRWVAAGAFRRNQITETLPWPHVMTAHSLYTFRTGILLDPECAAAALGVLLEGMTSGGWRQQTLEIPSLRLDSTLARELEQAARRRGYAWLTTPPRSVPAVFPQIVSEEYFANHWSSSRRKSLRRSKAKLEVLGSVELRLRRDLSEISPALETFLALERDSWKGEAGTACTSNSRDEAFIREMMAGMAEQNRVLISELCAGERVIASAINLVAGGGLFAFKIGWDRAWAAASPGVLHEAELMLATRDRLRDFTLFDSCASDDSYLAPIWPERIPVATGILCASRWSRCCHQAMQAARRLRRWISRRRTAPAATSLRPSQKQPQAVEDHDDRAALVSEHG